MVDGLVFRRVGSFAMFCQKFLLVACVAVLSLMLTAKAFSQPAAEKSIEQLISQLSDSDVVARRDAIYELVRRGDTSTVVIKALMDATRDKDVQVQIQSLVGLARAGAAAQPALDVLIEALDDRSDQVRLRAADAVGELGMAAVDSLLRKWPDSSLNFRVAACQAFQSMGIVAKPAVPVLMEAVTSTSTTPSAEEPAERGRRGERGSNRRARTLASYAAAALVAIEPENLELLLALADHADAATRLVGVSGLAPLTERNSLAIDRLRKATGDEDSQVRELALVVLGKANLTAIEKEAILEPALLDPAASVRAAANIALRRARLGGEPFAERLASRLTGADGASAVSVLEALSAVGPAAKVGLPQIVQAVEKLGVREAALMEVAEETSAETESDTNTSEDPRLPRELVVAVLAGMGPAVVAELLDVVSSKPELEPIVSAALMRIGQPAVESLLAGTRADNPAIRIASVRALGGMEPMSEVILERLIAASGEGDLQLRIAAVTALTRAAAENPAAQATVIRALHDEDAAVRAIAVGALATGGFSREQRRDGFSRGLTDDSPEVRVAALTGIANTPGQMQRQAELILEQTSATEDQVRAAAFLALANVPKEVVAAEKFGGPGAVPVAVLRGLRDPSDQVQIAATGVVAKLELFTIDNADAMSENLHASRDLVVATLEVLPKFSGDSVAIVQRLQPLLTHESSEVRIAAVGALTVADRDPVRLTTSLVPLLDDPEWVVRRIAGQSLGRQGSVAVVAVPKLFELLGRHEDKDYAAESLRQIDTAPVEALPMLIENLDAADRRKAFYAVTLIGKLGPAAAAAIEKLEAILQADSQGGTPLDDFRRNTIKEALAKIKPAN
jgi:HEAT repeat protein